MWTTSFWPSCLSNSFINSLTPLLLLPKLLAFCEKERVYWHQSALSFFCRTDVERLESQLNGDRRSEADSQRAHPFLLFHILFRESFLPFHRKLRRNLVAVRRAFMLFWALWLARLMSTFRGNAWRAHVAHRLEVIVDPPSFLPSFFFTFTTYTAAAVRW